MGTRRTNFILGIVVLAVSSAGAQQAAEQTSLQIFQRQGIGQDKVLQVTVNTGKNDEWFTPANPPANNLCNYSLYEVQHPDNPRMKIVDVTSNYLAYPPGGCGAVPVQLPASGDAETPYQLSLQTPLKFGVRYLFSIRNPADPNPDNNLVVYVFTASASLLVEPQQGKNWDVMVKSTVWLKASKGDEVTFINKSGKAGQPDTTIHGVVDRAVSQGVMVRLTDPLTAAQAGALQLTSQGLADNYKTDIHASSKGQPAATNTASGTPGQSPSTPAGANTGSGAAGQPTSAYFNLQFSATAAVHSTPTFRANGQLSPWNGNHMIDVSRGKAVYFDPVVNFDVGTNNSKSANTVTLPSPFTHDFTLRGNDRVLQAMRSNCMPGSLQHCGDFNNMKSVKYSSLNTSFGPREEFDTLYGGTNLLGEARLDLYPSFWYHPAAKEKAAQGTAASDISASKDSISGLDKSTIRAGNPAIRSQLKKPDGGWTIAPYLKYVGGGHVTAQTITNSGTNPAAVIPKYDISRLYLGLVFAGSYKLSSVNFEGSWVDMSNRETAPFTLNKVIYAKNVSGWQPHFLGTYSFSLDPAKRVSISFSWENGRTAPSFAYVNTATGGLQLQF